MTKLWYQSLHIMFEKKNRGWCCISEQPPLRKTSAHGCIIEFKTATDFMLQMMSKHKGLDINMHHNNNHSYYENILNKSLICVMIKIRQIEMSRSELKQAIFLVYFYFTYVCLSSKLKTTAWNTPSSLTLVSHLMWSALTN